MHISFLNWPPQRLVRESILNHNLRHPEVPLDAEESPWQVIVPVIYAFIRHELTNYDEELRSLTEGTYNEEKRNALAARIAGRARKAFPWLKKDPRPFPEPERGLELDTVARQLANLRTVEYHVGQVLAETIEPKREKELREKLESVREGIARLTSSVDRSPPPSERHVRVYSRPTESGEDYDWFGHSFHENYLLFAGLTCPACGAAVLASKRAVAFGQGQKRFFVSCHCLCVATEKFLRRIKLVWWEEALYSHRLLEESPPEEPPGKE